MFHPSDHSLLIHSLHGLLHLLQEHLWDSATQSIHSVQKLGLKWEEEGLEQVLLKRILKERTPTTTTRQTEVSEM